MANDYDFQGFMSSAGGAIFGAIIGIIIGILILVMLNLINAGIGNLMKIAILGVCMVAGAVMLALHEYKKQARERA